MSLRKCPDCGERFSTSAPACPRCGRPQRPSHLGLELAGIAAIAIGGMLAWRSFPESRPATLAPAAVAPAERSLPATIFAQSTRAQAAGLDASIAYNRTLAIFRIENRGSFAWSHCEFSLNAAGVSSGYTIEGRSVSPGLTEAAVLAAADFTGAAGRRFDPAAEPVRTLDLDCDTPRGHLYFGGRFEPPGGRPAPAR
jgi:hypothetical protein